jgi:Mg-chelatase subunit ChlD
MMGLLVVGCGVPRLPELKVGGRSLVKVAPGKVETKVKVEVWHQLAIDTGGVTVRSEGAVDIPDLMIRVSREGIPPGVPVDLVYVVDTTSSMADDIDEAKRRMRAILADLAVRNPDSLVGIVAYRDRGDEYVSRTFLWLAPDPGAIQAGIDLLMIDGGGDKREHVYAGLDLALRQQPWRPHAAHHIVLLGDAPPHEDYADDPRTYASTVELARARAVKIHTIGVHEGGLGHRGLEPADETTLDHKASMGGRYAGLIGTLEMSADVREYGAHHDFGHWEGGTHNDVRELPAGYWVYVAPTWYVWRSAR